MLKKKLALFLVIVFICSTAIAPVALAESAANSYVKTVVLFIGDTEAFVNDEMKTMDQAAYVKSDRTLVPFRFLGEALGAQVSWDPPTNTASLAVNGTEVKVTIGSKNAQVKGQPVVLDVPAETKGGRTFIPLRFVSEALGAEVDYDQELEMVTVTLVDTTGWKEYKDSASTEPLLYPPDWTVSGDTANTLTLTSPAGSTVTAKITKDDPLKIIANARDAHVSEGYVVDEEGPLDAADPDFGSMLVMTRFDDENIENTDFYQLDLINGGEQCLVLEINSKLFNSFDDAYIVTKMFLSN